MAVHQREILSPPQAAEMLSVTPRTLRNWLDRNLLEHVVMPSGRRFVPRTAIEALLVARPVIARETPTP